jgi:hypothetical protein
MGNRVNCHVLPAHAVEHYGIDCKITINFSAWDKMTSRDVVIAVRQADSDDGGHANISSSPPSLPLFVGRHTNDLVRALAPHTSSFAWPPPGAASMDILMLPKPGRLSLSILSGRIIESIVTDKKNTTITIGDSIRTFASDYAAKVIGVAKRAAA